MDFEFTKEEILTLVSLQEADISKVKIQNSIDTLLKEVAARRSKLAEQEELVRRAQFMLDEEQKNYREKELEANTRQDLMTKNQERISSIKTNKEYAAVLREIDDQKKKKASVEEAMFLSMERIEGLEKQLQHAQAIYKAASENTETEVEKLLKSIEDQKKDLMEAEKLRSVTQEKVPQKLAQLFDRARERVKPPVVVAADNAVCSGCHMNIPAQVYNELHRLNNLKLCPFCERILFLKRILDDH